MTVNSIFLYITDAQEHLRKPIINHQVLLSAFRMHVVSVFKICACLSIHNVHSLYRQGISLNWPEILCSPLNWRTNKLSSNIKSSCMLHTRPCLWTMYEIWCILWMTKSISAESWISTTCSHKHMLISDLVSSLCT